MYSDIFFSATVKPLEVMRLQQDPQGPELSPVTCLHTADSQHVKDLNYIILEKRKTT
jgi:hypothetical protein